MPHRLEREMQGIEKAVKDLTQMEESLKGQGGEALRNFYAKMKEAGVKTNNGNSMNMEQPHPGVGGRHRETYTYGLTENKLEEYLNLSYRDALAHDILDAKRIYMKDGVYTPEIREGLLNTIRMNRDLYPELFN